MKKRYISFMNQILIICSLIVVLPFTIIIFFYTLETLKKADKDYQDILKKANIQVETGVSAIISNAERLSYLHIVNDSFSELLRHKHDVYDWDFLKDNKIDIQILGIGNNGHIGFNEPDSYFTASAHKVELAEETIKANARFFEKESDVPRSAITMGMYGIATAAKVILVATGAAKAPAIKKLLESDHVDPQLPCSILHICEDATVIVDKDLYELTK